MSNTTPHPHKLVSLSLVFLLTGLLGCSHGSQGEQAAGAKAAPATAAASGSAGSAGSAGSGSGAASAPQGAAAAAAPAAPSGASAPSGSGMPAAGAAQPAAAPVPLSQDKIPAVVAKVNGAPISKAELIKMADQLHSQVPNMPETAEFYRRVLDQLVGNKLLVDEATAAGITIPDDEVNKQLNDLKTRMTLERYQEELKKEGLTEAELVKQTRETLMVQKLVDTKVVNDVKVSDQEVKAFYDQNPDKLKRPERVHVRHILIGVGKDATPADKEKAKAKANDILAKIKAGGDFAKLAAENSDDPGSKQHGGDLPTFGRGQMVGPFENAAFALKQPNELAPVVESQYGFHIIQLVEHQDAGLVPFPEVKDRIANFLKQQQQKDKFMDHVKELKAKGKVETFI